MRFFELSGSSPEVLFLNLRASYFRNDTALRAGVGEHKIQILTPPRLSNLFDSRLPSSARLGHSSARVVTAGEPAD
jgi:hypothetical protein